MEDGFKISLAAARVNANMTQHEVAKKMHIAPQTVVNWEKGKVKPPLVSLDFMARLYDVPIDYIRI